LLAFEVARQLYLLNEAVSKVMVFDSRHHIKKTYSFGERLNWTGSMLVKEHHRYLRYILKEVIIQLGAKLGFTIHSQRMVPIEITTGGIRPIRSLRFHDDYDPQPFPLELLVFFVRDTEYSIRSGNELTRWKQHSLNPVEYYRIDADYHNQILNEEYLEGICHSIREFLKVDNS
jgi:thioesterase domain-containing protein